MGFFTQGTEQLNLNSSPFLAGKRTLNRNPRGPGTPTECSCKQLGQSGREGGKEKGRGLTFCESQKTSKKDGGSVQTFPSGFFKRASSPLAAFIPGYPKEDSFCSRRSPGLAGSGQGDVDAETWHRREW